MILNILISILALLITIYILKKNLGLFLVSYIIFIQYIWMFFSIIEIESGIYINEQGRNGYFVYSSLILFLFFISTLISLILFQNLFLKLLRKEKPIRFKFLKFKEEKIINIGIFLLLFIAFYNLLSSPIPLFDKDITKFNFWEFAKYPFLKAILGNIMGFIAFGSALVYRNSKKYSILLLILYFTYLILMGQKFTGFLIGSYGIFVALYFSSEFKIKFKLRWVFNKYFISTAVLMFLLVLYYYSIKNPFAHMGLTPLESVFYRTFGLQAHVFWGTVEHYVHLNKPNTWNVSELWNGMHLLMKEFWPWSYDDFLSVTSRGVSWTNAYPAILLRIFPWPIAVIVNFFLFSFVALIQSLLIFFIEKRSYIFSIILFQLLTWVSYAYTMAYFNKLLLPIIFVIFLIIMKILIYENKLSKNRL